MSVQQLSTYVYTCDLCPSIVSQSGATGPAIPEGWFCITAQRGVPRLQMPYNAHISYLCPKCAEVLPNVLL
jgi:hypothetical protein